MALWIVGAWGDRRWRLGTLRVPLAVALPLALAAAEEAAQLLSARRTADVRDLAADAAGLVVFWLLGRRLFREPLRARRRDSPAGARLP